MSDSVEFYLRGKEYPFCSLQSSFQPIDGDLINIKKQTYVVIGRSFSVDHSDQPGRSIRCNVIVDRHPISAEAKSHE